MTTADWLKRTLLISSHFCRWTLGWVPCRGFPRTASRCVQAGLWLEALGSPCLWPIQALAEFSSCWCRTEAQILADCWRGLLSATAGLALALAQSSIPLLFSGLASVCHELEKTLPLWGLLRWCSGHLHHLFLRSTAILHLCKGVAHHLPDPRDQSGTIGPPTSVAPQWLMEGGPGYQEARAPKSLPSVSQAFPGNPGYPEDASIVRQIQQRRQRCLRWRGQ